MNQCDGCNKGLPIVNGIHQGNGYDMIGCTKERYEVDTMKTYMLIYKSAPSSDLVVKLTITRFIKAYSIKDAITKVTSVDHINGIEYNLIEVKLDD